MMIGEGRAPLLTLKAQLERSLSLVNGVLAAIEAAEEAMHDASDDALTACPHLHTADVGTMQAPGRRLCLDCDAQIP